MVTTEPASPEIPAESPAPEAPQYFTYSGATPEGIPAAIWPKAPVVTSPGGAQLYTYLGTDPVDTSVWTPYSGATEPAPA